MAKVLVHVPIQDGWHGESWLLETEFEMAFLPDEGDLFHPLKNDPASGLTMAIYRRWWQEDGSASLQTHTYVIDPPQDLKGHFENVYRQWNSGLDGDLVGKLMDNGWWAYGKRPAEETATTEITAALDLVKRRILEGLATSNEVVDYLRKGL